MTADQLDRDYAAATAQALAEAEALPELTEPQAKLHIPSAEELTTEHKAVQLRDVVPAAYVYGAASGIFKDTVDLASCQVYLNQLLEAAGNPDDPVARMMLEQLAMAHHAIGRLHVRAATRESLPEVLAYHGVLARLMSEFRKTSLALQVFRSTSAEQAGSIQKPAQGGDSHTDRTVTIREPATAVAAARHTKLEGNDGVEGRDRKANCA